MADSCALPDDQQVLLSNIAELKPYFPLIAIAAEITWNLREWIRECHDRPNLKPVLQARLPHVRSQLELGLVDCHLAAAVAELPHGDQLTAAALIAFVEELKLPNGTKIKIPAGEPPLRWTTLSRTRAKQIALQVVDDNGALLFDPENTNDLNEIEAMDGDYLAGLWQAMEAHNQSPADVPLLATNEAPTDDGSPESRRRRGRKKADYETEQEEAELAAAWKQAKIAGTYKVDFSREHGMKTADFDKLLTRVRKRKQRAWR